MNIAFILAQSSAGALLFKKPGTRAKPVCTAAEAARLLGRTRRQVYRYIQTKAVVPRAKVLGEWLLDRSDVERLARNPLSPQPVPARLGPLLPEYRTRDLNAGRDGVLVLARVLESGGRQDLRWAFKRYGRRALSRFVVAEGSRLLSPRSLALWSLCLGVRAEPTWRRQATWP